MDESTNRKLKNRLRRAHGQLAAVDRALDDDGHPDCIALLTQLAAVEGALQKIRQLLLTHHVETCVADALATGNAAARAAQIDELMDIIGRQLSR